jgi:hypothetical protein
MSAFARIPILRQHARMVSLSDYQLQTIITARAAAIELGKRSTFLERVGARRHDHDR